MIAQVETPLRWFAELLRCVQPARSGVCGSPIDFDGQSAVCSRCRHSYAVVQHVPVLKPEVDPEVEKHYDDLAGITSRDEQRRAGHLADIARSIEDFVRDHSIVGPILEVGCGLGLLSDRVPKYVGLEYSLGRLLTRGFENAARVCGDARQLPFADGAFQLAVSLNVLEHVDRVDSALAEIDRVLQPGGYALLKPAWHCTRYNTELIPVKRYGELTLRQKCVKAALPVLQSRGWKFATKVPWRLWRRLTARKNNPLSWGRLTPHYGADWIADSDATTSIDSHEGILYFESRDYDCPSHPRRMDRILAGHDLVIVRKPLTRT
jgi:SAM-dependent methyltransferase